MTNPLPPLISAAELKAIGARPEVVTVEAGSGKDARSLYALSHLDGAVFLDLNTDLADIKPDARQGGRHPLPSPEAFSLTMRQAGISARSHVVVYDRQSGANAAARLWWMLRAAGLNRVQVLDGGFAAAEQAGCAINALPVVTRPAETFSFEKWQLPVADMREVERVAQKPDYMVIDVRDKVRYDGDAEPIDLIAGHIPGAVNMPFAGNLDERGQFRTAAELKEKYESLLAGKPAERVIVHCGSGVTACHTLLAMAHAGFDIPSLYVGSWSEWSRNEKPMVTKKTDI